MFVYYKGLVTVEFLKYAIFYTYVLQAEYLIHCGVKENRNGAWVRSTRHKVVKMAFGCNDDYDTVRDRLVKEFKIDDSVVLLDMEDNLVDHKNFSIYQYVQNHKKYCGATRIYIGILLCLRVNDKSGLDENQSRSGSVEEATQKSAADNNQPGPCSVEEAIECIRKEVKELKNRSADLDSEGLENIDTEKFCPVFADPKILCFEKEMNKTYSHVLCGYGNFIIVPKDEMDIFETWKTKNKNLFFVDEAILYFLSYVYNDEEVVNVKEVATNVWQLDAEVADKFRTWKEAMVAAYCKDTCNM